MVDSFKKQRDALLMEKRMKKDESEAVEDEIAEEQVYICAFTSSVGLALTRAFSTKNMA